MKAKIWIYNRLLALFVGLLIGGFIPVTASVAEGTLVEVVVHSPALEGNLLEDTPDRNVTIYLPPGYNENTDELFPSVYLLHGFTGNNTLWTGQGYPLTPLPELNINEIADALIEEGEIAPMIIVMPDASNKYLGSWYSNSSVAGNWEDFLTEDLMRYVDTNYRTLSQPASRGIAGHSMGGYGAMVLAMKNPDTYRAVYAMSAGMFSTEGIDPIGEVFNKNGWRTALTVNEWWSEGDPVGYTSLNQFFAWLYISEAAAFSPNPDNPPILCDFPVELVDGETKSVTTIMDQWNAQTPLGMIQQYGANLSQFQGVQFDVGSSDFFVDIPISNRSFSAALTQAGIAHVFEEYDGDHSNRLVERMRTKILPFFSDMLVSEPQKTIIGIKSWGYIKAENPE